MYLIITSKDGNKIEILKNLTKEMRVEAFELDPEDVKLLEDYHLQKHLDESFALGI